MKLKSLPVANPICVLREEFDDWAVLFHPDTAAAVGINPVGVSIWKIMDGRHSLEEIVKKVEEEYSEVPGTAPDEIKLFVDNLAENGFVGYEVAGGE